jgi:hypothetical protein
MEARNSFEVDHGRLASWVLSTSPTIAQDQGKETAQSRKARLSIEE